MLAGSVLGPTVEPADLATQSFIGLGGDSILAMRLVALSHERLGVHIPVASLLGAVLPYLSSRFVATLSTVLAVSFWDAYAGAKPSDIVRWVRRRACTPRPRSR